MINKEKNFASAVIYVYNAENRIRQFLTTIIEVFEQYFEHSEIICVNDFSSDASVELIREVSKTAQTTSVSVVQMSYFHGLELSMNAGIDMAIGDFVFEFDNTVLDFVPDVIMQIYFQALKGYDIVSASVNVRPRLTSRLFYQVFDRYTHLSQKLSTESFRVLSRRVLNRIASMNKTIPYRKAVYANCGLKTFHMKYDAVRKEMVLPDHKEKNYRSRLAMDSLILFTELGYSFSKTMTVLMMLVSAFMLIYSVAVYVTAHPVAGWTTTVLFLAVAFFGLFAILTIIIKYLQLLVELVFKRKQYSFESIEKLTK